MIRRNLWLAAVAVGTLSVTTAHAQINGLKTNVRVLNDFSTSILTPVNNNSVNAGPGLSLASIDDRVMVDDSIPGSFANRHDFTFSSDGGATNHVFTINDSYTVKTLVTLADGSNAPRKEVGFYLKPSLCCDLQFLVNSDAGEIVTFGGPFHSFGSNGGGNGYTPGTTILMGFTMTAAGDGNGPLQNQITFFIDRLPGVVGGEDTFGPVDYGNGEGGPPFPYTISLYTQASPANAADFVTSTFNDIMFSPITTVPEPASCMLSLLGIMGLAFIRRRGTR
jgi:hypothetical protein